jgi:endo-1,4-beta-D-glucanase Y
MRTAVAVVLASALAISLASCGSSQRQTTTVTAATRPSGPGAPPNASPTKLATDAAYSFLDSYTTDGGRIQRTDQGGDTVGEGQAYGMLAAAAVGDQQRFDRIWAWTKSNMLRSNGLLAFHWVGGRVVDPHPAADADLDAARALLLAGCRFRRPDLRAAGVRIGDSVLAQETARAGPLDVLIAGPWANMGSHLVFNPSYVDPTTLDALAGATGNPRFRAVATGSTQLVNELTRPLPPDWSMVDSATGQVTPVSAASSTSGPGMFTYDAPRTLVRFAVDPGSAGQAAVARAWGVFRYTQPQDIVTEHQLSGAAVGTSHDAVTLVGAAGAAKAAGDGAAVPALLAEAQQLNAQHPTYYGSAWVALGRLMLTTNLLQPCSG